ncbi:SRPBCC family protein [Roseibium sediminicola]|uniref:SRPBCC domain-containing protein n=1 Tax=Roseibium sediminicola TaxID=2933272 RepID=A0ABT0GVM9_9HYPH|nr:SRPBCC domain-containing protein [Roseibium sp. CAU 1639]MCK7613488.1 SRPBCC domain-containing protein [Roseibium sp. CAU 1639]
MTVQQPAREFLKSEPGLEPVIVEGLFRATPARVFRAFTEPEEVRCWFLPKGGNLVAAEIDLKVGGRWCFVIEKTDEKQIHFEGEYLAIEAPNRLEFSWRHVQEFADGTREATDSSKVTVLFEEAGKATEVKLRHEAIKTEDARRGVGGGWNGCFLRLVEFVVE